MIDLILFPKPNFLFLEIPRFFSNFLEFYRKNLQYSTWGYTLSAILGEIKSREQLRKELAGTQYAKQVLIPEDGERIEII